MNLDKKDVARALYCSSIIEDEVANAYNSLAEKAENEVVKTFLKFISLDSKKHAAVFRGLARVLEKQLEVDCEKYLGKAGERIIEEARRVKEMEIKKLPELVDNIASLENFVGEEYLTLIHVKTLRFIAEKEKIDLDSLNMVLNWIVEDEKRHETIVRLLAKIIK